MAGEERAELAFTVAGLACITFFLVSLPMLYWPLVATL
jgi:hypothetical protein